MLKVENLNVRYKDSLKTSIQNVSFSISKGEIVAIMGPSGCGKTTTLNVLAGLLTEEEVEIKGDILFSKIQKGDSINNQKPQVRMVFQTPRLLPWRTVEKNIALGLEIKKYSKDEIDKKVQEMIEMVGLEGFEKYYPSKLSMGMQQRVNFARALVCKPDLLLLDEPFSALDRNTKEKIQENFLEVLKKNEITSILVTHSQREAEFFTKKIVVFPHKKHNE